MEVGACTRTYETATSETEFLEFVFKNQDDEMQDTEIDLWTE